MSKKILFLSTYPKDSAPSQRFRYEQYLADLSREYDVQTAPFIGDKLWEIYYQKGKFVLKSILLVLAYFKRVSILLKLRNKQIFIHREITPLGPPLFEFIIAKVLRKKYIYDFDDAIWLPNFSEANSAFQRIKMYGKVKYIIRWADQVVTGNEYLANYARQYNKNVQVIPTTIDTVNHHNILSDHSQEKLVIGWTGTHSTMHYLDRLIPIIAELEQKYDFEFRVISNKKPDYPLKSLHYMDWTKETEIEDLSKLHIGVMPLTDDQWSEGKCGFKGLQYMALQIACVMSPVGVNKQIVQSGINGYLVDTDREWYEILEALILDPALRERIGVQGRKRIEEAYSVKSQLAAYRQLFR